MNKKFDYQCVYPETAYHLGSVEVSVSTCFSFLSQAPVQFLTHISPHYLLKTSA